MNPVLMELVAKHKKKLMASPIAATILGYLAVVENSLAEAGYTLIVWGQALVMVSERLPFVPQL